MKAEELGGEEDVDDSGGPKLGRHSIGMRGRMMGLGWEQWIKGGHRPR